MVWLGLEIIYLHTDWSLPGHVSSMLICSFLWYQNMEVRVKVRGRRSLNFYFDQL